ncbi:MAG: hypothetical protein CVU90_01710 [Firmicutes bacterium HGW-Firmicutes-15]|nr:MAG: hypothetical protein CVU90_01710 [Firmicutes bacterium HGW-Firmicutes-15]
MANKYIEYFNINELYFPCIDEEAIRAGAPWANTYPHETFITLLRHVERMLSGDKKPVWIHGAYGTGKSQCGYALKKILEVPEPELRAYWDKFDALQTNTNKDLLEKLIGHKFRRIVTAYRYASGGINGTRDLLLAVQDSIKAALVESGVEYTGENTLKESVIAWLEDPLNKKHFDEYLELPEFTSRFSQSTADEVLKDLRKGGELKELMENIFYLSDKRGITAFELNTDRLIDWIKDIITKNDIKIVLVWDEFSSFFKNNRNSLDEFQKIASLAQSTSFYFVIVTHQTSSVIANKEDQAWKVVQQRYEFTEITLPDSIAFDLIGSALEVIPSAQTSWNKIADDINSWVPESRTAVMKAAGITNPNVIKKIMPLHPYAAMVLKYIATAFEANQRSMFDFIKTTNNDDVKAFQWFIANNTPEDDRPLLTVDLLWNFFYEKGRNNLTPDIQSILDTFPRQQDLQEKEKAVLKTILIIQAIDQRTRGEMELFRVTDKNLSLAFEGVNALEGNSAVNIAKKLVKDGVLYKKPIGNGIEVYAAAALAGDQTKIDKHKKDIRTSTTTAKLVTEGGLASVLPLTSALKLRFDVDPPNGKLLVVTYPDFTKTINALRDKQSNWRFFAVIAFAKDDAEVPNFRKAIKEAAANPEYTHITFIDALSTPLGADAFEQYVEFSAVSMYYSRNDDTLSKDYNNKAKRVLDTDWKDRIEKGAFIVSSYSNKDGERYPNANGVIAALESTVIMKFPSIFDFKKGLNENMLKLTQGRASAKHGALQTSGNAVGGIEKYTLAILPNSVWKVDRYWEQPTLSSLLISKIKIRIEEKITEAFNRDGQISIRELYDVLENDYGFAPSNLSAFLAGFLLKEYGGEPYRYWDSQNGHESMSPDKLAEMLGIYIGNTNHAKYKDTYIVNMTSAEMAFYALTEKAFEVLPNSCATAGQAAHAVETKMRLLGLPVWVLSEVDDYGVYDIVEKYITLVQKEGKEAHQVAIEIGKVAEVKSNLGDNLHALITKGNCQKGMLEFLKTFEDGKILDLAKAIGAEGNLINDIRKRFNVERSCLWIISTGESEIRKLLTEYGVVLESNNILGVNANSRQKCFSDWREKLKFIHVSSEHAKVKCPELTKLFDFLSKIYAQNEILPDQLKAFQAELQANSSRLAAFLSDEKPVFDDVYSPYLEGFSPDDIDDIISKLPLGMFSLSPSECNVKVKEKAEEFRKGQLKEKLFALWKEKTGTNNPKEWSRNHKIPILCLVVGNDYDNSKKVFETLNQHNPPEFAIKTALAHLETATFFADLSDDSKCKEAFRKHIFGEYSKILKDIGVVLDKLDRLTIEPYDWFSHPQVKETIRKLAEAEYNAGGSDRALAILSAMTSEQRDEYIKRLVTENISVGIEIITRGGE